MCIDFKVFYISVWVQILVLKIVQRALITAEPSNYLITLEDYKQCVKETKITRIDREKMISNITSWYISKWLKVVAKKQNWAFKDAYSKEQKVSI